MKRKTDSPKVIPERLTPRIGKIARLPKAVREQLNQQLEDGQEGHQLLGWLNALPAVQAVLKKDFGGEPITKQNLSQWRRGGYRDWQMRQTAMEAIHRLVGDAEELRQTSVVPLTDTLALWLAAQYVVVAKSSKGGVDWRRLRELCNDLVELRKGDHSAGRLRLERERFDLEREQIYKLSDEEHWEWASANFDEIFQRHERSKVNMKKLVKLMFGEWPAPKPLPSELSAGGAPPCGGDKSNSADSSQQSAVGDAPLPAVGESKPVAPSQTTKIEESPGATRNA